MQKITLPILTVALLTIAGNGSAATDRDFNRLDANLDGLIAWSEYAANNPKSGRLHPRRIFDNVDINRDGYIDPKEFAEMKRRRNK